MECRERIIEISRQRGTTHISSCLTALPVIEEIYREKGPNDVFILSNGHAFLAWAVVMEAHEGKDAFKLAEKHGTHPTRDPADGITVSTGSLGHGGGISIGISLANRSRKVYTLMSDGELGEGSCWEAMRLKKELGLDNLKFYFNLNGYSALASINREDLAKKIKLFCPDAEIRFTENGDDYSGVTGHYAKAK